MELEQLRSATGYPDLAELFGISTAEIAQDLYGNSKSFRTFSIPKKSGGIRIIDSPVGTRRALQRRLAHVLSDIYHPTAHAHGFVVGRSVISNALKHTNKRLLVNIDLLDFFHSITFRRVRGLFLTRPFKFSWPVANVLAQICCHEGRLPAGGITSPTISNFILHRLDKKCYALARRLGGDYSRYADDLTFSFDRRRSDITELIEINSAGNVEAGKSIIEILNKEGFKHNPAKLRIAGPGARQTVTGITSNIKCNVSRRWLNNLKAKIYVCNKFGIAQLAKSDFPALPIEIAIEKTYRTLHGKLAFLHMVRGKGDWISAGLAAEFLKIPSATTLSLPITEQISFEHRATLGILVVTASLDATHDATLFDAQGTGFVLSNGFVVTANHVIEIDEDVTDTPNQIYPNIEVRDARNHTMRYKCEVITRNKHRDLAVLRPLGSPQELTRHCFNLGGSSATPMRVMTVGFPAYSIGHKPSQQAHEVIQTRKVSAVEKGIITGDIKSGLSGAPVIDKNLRVIGIVHRKVTDLMPNEIIMASELTKTLQEANIHIAAL